MKFKEVFNIVLKVWLSLLIISIVVGIISILTTGTILNYTLKEILKNKSNHTTKINKKYAPVKQKPYFNKITKKTEDIREEKTRFFYRFDLKNGGSVTCDKYRIIGNKIILNPNQDVETEIEKVSVAAITKVKYSTEDNYIFYK